MKGTEICRQYYFFVNNFHCGNLGIQDAILNHGTVVKENNK